MTRFFTVTHGDRSYAVMAGTHATIETVWAQSEMLVHAGAAASGFKSVNSI